MKYKNHLIYFIVVSTLWGQAMQDTSPLDEMTINLNIRNKDNPRAKPKPGLDYQGDYVSDKPIGKQLIPGVQESQGNLEIDDKNRSPGTPSADNNGSGSGDGSGGCGRKATAGIGTHRHAEKRNWTPSPLDGRIVGGVDAEPNEWPWQAALFEPSPDGPFQYCGGILISEQHVLTAAHCIDSYKLDGLQVSLGDYDINKTGETEDVKFKVANKKVHELYNSKNEINDIGLIKLDKPIIRSISVRPACLPPANENFTNTVSYATGWGVLTFGGKPSSILQEVDVRTWENDACRSTYLKPDTPIHIKDTHLCANGENKDSCQGDSGGPLNCIDPKTNYWVLCGITSVGINCALADKPGIYTRVSSYLKWIQDNMRKM